MEFWQNLEVFLIFSVFIAVCVFLGGFIRLYVIAKIRLKTVIIISLVMYVAMEIYAVYFCFFK